jgi:ubiquinone/menaquinone biosynthesis C-methylase UbiE
MLDPTVLSFLPKDLGDKTILDVACGLGDWGFLMRTRKLGHSYLIGLDIWHPNLERLRPIDIYSELVDARIPPIPFKNKSIDISVACEILEHLPKEVGSRFLAELERVTNERIIVSVPLNFPQGEAYGNPYEKHVSKWSPSDLLKHGYDIMMVNTLPKTLRVVDGIRRFVFKLPPTPKLVVGRKFLQ